MNISLLLKRKEDSLKNNLKIYSKNRWSLKLKIINKMIKVTI